MRESELIEEINKIWLVFLWVISGKVEKKMGREGNKLTTNDSTLPASTSGVLITSDLGSNERRL